MLRLSPSSIRPRVTASSLQTIGVERRPTSPSFQKHENLPHGVGILRPEARESGLPVAELSPRWVFRRRGLDQGDSGTTSAIEVDLDPSTSRNGAAAFRHRTSLWTLQPGDRRGEPQPSIRAIQARSDRLEALVERQATLLREMNHRIANSLAIEGSLVRMQLKDVSDAAARQALLETEHRLSAIMHVHRSLYASTDYARTELGSYLRGLIADLERSLLASASGPRLKLDVIPVSVPTDRVIPIGIIVSELVTNALKYAYPIGSPPGEIRVQLREAADLGVITVTVEDDGIGFAASQPGRSGAIGRRVIDAMASSLDARISIDPLHHGARVIVAFAS
jgi:two-component sensor histidine kinase